jgi:hypothetical protein
MMKTKLMVIIGIIMLLSIALLPTASVKAADKGQSAFQNADNPAQLVSDGRQNGNRTGPQDGTKGENAPRDGRGRGNGKGPRDGSGNGARRGQGGGPRDGSGPGCQQAK